MMFRRTLVLLGLGALLLSLSSCASQVEHQRALQENANLQKTIDELNAYQAGLDDKLRRLRAENDRLSGLARSKEELEAEKLKLQELMDEFARSKSAGTMTEQKGVTIIEDPLLGRGFRIEGALLFASGKAELTEEGKKTLKGLLPMLSKRKGIRVVGHTDTDPITHSDWSSNLDLSAGRAVAVADELEKIGIPYERMHVIGFGSSVPAGPGPRDKAKDRRVELFLID
jgi:flagellar motor protein MotB